MESPSQLSLFILSLLSWLMRPWSRTLVCSGGGRGQLGSALATKELTIAWELGLLTTAIIVEQEKVLLSMYGGDCCVVASSYIKTFPLREKLLKTYDVKEVFNVRKFTGK